MLPLQHLDSHRRLLRFNVQVLDQALDLVAAHDTPGAPDYAGPVGAHLRHVIEHYEALLQPATPGVVDYDQRPRDRCLERDAAVADARIRALQRRLAAAADLALDMPLQVRGVGGLAGDFAFTVVSTLVRELVFVASHAIHHFALLNAHCERNGITLGAGFGRAPATVAHARMASAHIASIPHKESPCHHSPLNA